MSAPLLEIRKVTACYGVLPILHGIDLDIRKGEIVALIGANGAGKTTLMMTIFGRPRANEGQHSVPRARHHRASDAHEVARLGIVQSPEGRRIFSRMTVLENLQMGAIVANDPAGFDADLQRVYALFPLLKSASQSTRRHAVGRRAANARDRPRADGAAEPALAGRAVARTCAADREADLRRRSESSTDRV